MRLSTGLYSRYKELNQTLCGRVKKKKKFRLSEENKPVCRSDVRGRGKRHPHRYTEKNVIFYKIITFVRNSLYHVTFSIL